MKIGGVDLMKRLVGVFVSCSFCLSVLSFQPLGKLQRQKSNTNDIIIATWNIGHFSKGKKANSSILGNNFEDQLKHFRTIVYDSISADLLCVNEFSPVFGKNADGMEQASTSVLFNGFEKRKAYEQLGFCCNAVFSNLKMKNVRRHNFKCSHSYIEKESWAANYYYMSGDIYINDIKIKLLCVHLVPSTKIAELRKEQISELIRISKKWDKVIMCGDWNTNNLAVFRDAGYKLANNSKIVTFPSKSYSLDNIIVKGLKISDVRVIKTKLVTDYETSNKHNERAYSEDILLLCSE